MSTATVVPAVPSQDLIIDSPGHEYDGRLVTFVNIVSENQKVMVHVEDDIYVTLGINEVRTAPHNIRKTTYKRQGDLIA